MATSIRCTLPNCSCECFAPGKNQLRTCEQCRHGWVAHALDKLSTGHSCPSLCVEVVHSDIVFDITSLLLYGTQATPIRLRILLDRLFSVLKSEEVDRILQGLGWGHEDYARGYVLQDQDGKVLEHWTVVSKEEEPIILNQFLRFGETKSIAEVMLQELKTADTHSAQKKNESDIRAFIERISGRHKVNNTFDGSEVNRLTSSPESSRTMQKSSQQGGMQDGEGQSSGKSFQQRESSQGSDLPAQNIHLANLEQTVLKAGVVQTQTHSRGRVGYTNANPQPVKRPTTAMNSTHDIPTSSVNSSPTLLNSSISMLPGTVRRYPSFSFKGHRKLALSKRRAWTPYMTLPNSKQVKCNTCHKWFYDKGTWKIHFGAVHLKVKYRCTVDGCNMAFSSLRSRNRHSGNPSPRIHRFVYSRRGNKRRSIPQGEDVQLQPECEERVEKMIEVDEDDVAMVTDDNNVVKEEENHKAMEEEEVTILESERENSGGDSSETSPHNSAPDVINQGEITRGEDNSATDAMQNIKEETSEELVENSDDMESQSLTPDPKPSENPEQVQPANDSPTMHHFKKRKSNAPRKFFIPKQEDDADCQVESVTFKREDTAKQNDDILDPEEEETGIDLEEIAEYETNLQDDGSSSNDYHYIPSHGFSHKVRQLPELPPTSQAQGLENMHLDQNHLRHRVAEQLGIGIDTCYYINAEGLPSCYLCGKTFQSKQTVKVHYQNVHLKLMHACTIDGCNAMFPSRRSRDRHSTNFNLHRKLFEKGVPLKDGFEQIQPPNPTFCSQPGQAGDQAQSSNHALSDSNSSNSSEGIRKGLKQTGMDTSPNVDSGDNGSHHPSPNEIDLRLTKPELHSSSKHRYPVQDNNTPSSSYGSSPPQRYIMQVDQNGLSPLTYNQTFNTPNPPPIPPPKELYPLKFVGNLICNICKKAYSTKDTLRTHYRNIHLREMHKCTVQGCNLMFSSVRSRNRHSQNPNLHRHCLGAENNPDEAEQIDVTQ